MKSFNILLILILFFSNPSFSQTCLPLGITFSTQLDVDNFPTQYPNCTEVVGNVKIKGSVENLDSLIQISSIGGSLEIDTCLVLENIDGLENLISIGGDFNLRNNKSLKFFPSFNNLTSIGNELFIRLNDSLITIPGLNNLTSTGRILIAQNPELSNITGFNSLVTGNADMIFGENISLTDISGFSSLENVIGDFRFAMNSALADISGFSNLEVVGGQLDLNELAISNFYVFNNLVSVGNTFRINNNNVITNLNGFENLTSLSGELIITANENLTNLSGLQNLTSFGGRLIIAANTELINLQGLESITEIDGEIVIGSNSKLISVEGIANIDANTISQLSIAMNSLLAICNETSICNYISSGGTINISNNAIGCNSDIEILANCLPACPSDIIFSTQAEVDNFPNQYPNCTEIEGNVTITGSVINLDSLDQIISIGGDLVIEDCEELETISGMENLTELGGDLNIKGNDSLTIITGFENLMSVNTIDIRLNFNLLSFTGFNTIQLVNGTLLFYNNDDLEEITGFNSLTTVESNLRLTGSNFLNNISGFSNLQQIDGELNLVALDLLNLQGFSNLSSVGDLIVYQNAGLTSLEGLENLNSIDGKLSITANESLEDLTVLQNITSIGGTMQIGGNTNLTDLQGLENITSISGNLIISSNHNLTSIEGIKNINANSISELTIYNNLLLEICNETNICEFLSTGGIAFISDNASICNTQAEIEASCLPPGSGSSCNDAIQIYDLDGYSNTLVSINDQDQPSTFCGVVSNNQWIAFTAGTTDITLDIFAETCLGTASGTGLQAQVYEGCGIPWTPVSNCLYEVLPNSTGTLIMEGLTVGNNYYLMVDGFAGDICNYTINVTNGVTIPPISGNCPDIIDGFTTLGEFGDSKYYISNDFSQPIAAQTLAETYGGFLASISSQEENDFIQQNISEMVYLGLNDFEVEGNLAWENGETLIYNNINPCSFCNENNDDLDFVIMAPWDGAWSFSSVWNSRKFIMEIPCGGASSSEISINCPDDINISLSNGATNIIVDFPNPLVNTTCAGGNIILEQISGAPSGTAFEAGEYNITFEATDSCGNIKNCSFLITVEEEVIPGDCPDEIIGFTTLGEFENSKYYLSNDNSRAPDAQQIAISHGGYLTSIGSQAENDFIQQNISEMVYIGLNDYDTEGNLEWYNNEDFIFDNINPCNFCNENSDDMDFIIMAPWDGAWSFSNFFNSRKYVMEIPCGGNTGSSLSINCPPEQFIEVNAGTNEAIISFDEVTANSNCPDGGIIITQVSGPEIGESKPIGKYTLIYSITDACGNQTQCIVIVNVIPSNNSGCPDNLPEFTFLGEFENSSYFISNDVERPSDAQVIAESIGGNLAVISSQEENDFIGDQIGGLVYIGLNDYDTEGTLEWVDGSSNGFTNFDICNFCNENSEDWDFVVMHSWNGAWSWSNFYNARKYIVEIPCTSTLINPTPISSLAAQAPKNSIKPKLDALVPNPAKDFIIAKITSQHEMVVEILIYDARGTLVKKDQASLFIGANTPVIDISNLTAGFYSIYIPQAKVKFATEKFVKIRD